jgi:hypothetical protein
MKSSAMKRTASGEQATNVRRCRQQQKRNASQTRRGAVQIHRVCQAPIKELRLLRKGLEEKQLALEAVP